MIDELARYGMEIIDQTPNINSNRPLEIKTWLDSRTDKDEIVFVSLDDDFSVEDYKVFGLEHCFVKTSFYCNAECDGGLQPHHVEKAIQIFTKDGYIND